MIWKIRWPNLFPIAIDPDIRRTMSTIVSAKWVSNFPCVIEAVIIIFLMEFIELILDFDQLMKRRSQNVDEDNVCLKSLCRSYLRDSGLIARTNVSKNKTIYLRISTWLLQSMFVFEDIFHDFDIIQFLQDIEERSLLVGFVFQNCR